MNGTGSTDIAIDMTIDILMIVLLLLIIMLLLLYGVVADLMM